MTYEVQQTRWDRIVRRVTGSVGPGSRVSETISELMPVLDIERVPAELLLLGGTQICMGQTNTAAVVAQFSQSMIRNPLDSNTIITVTQAVVHSATAQFARAGPTLNVFAVAGTQAIRDGRVGLLQPPVGVVLSDSLLVSGPLFFRFFLDGTQDSVLKDPNDLAVLAPGTAFSVSNTGTDADLQVGWMWRERPAEPSELQF